MNEGQATLKNTRIRRAGLGMVGFATVLASVAIVMPDASASMISYTVTPGVGGDPSVYTLSTTLAGSPEDATAQVYFYDWVYDSTGTHVTVDNLIGGGPQQPVNGTVQVTWYPTTIGDHVIEVVERSASGQMINTGGPAVHVDQLPKTSGPAVTEVTGGSITSNLITVSGRVFHPNGTYTLSVPMDQVPAGSTVFFKDGITRLADPTVSNGVASVQFTPTTIGTHTITAYYVAPGAPPAGNWFAGQSWVEVTTPPATGGGGTSTGSADSFPVIGGLMKALGL
ncbi:hypothetical protein [Nocardia tengchongensis]|uniref:hypothetical protein n=1 Tax=Nocardia tengchongensis TaxID=2055889 RepID=UPI0036C40497